jgi:hypothetical protein
LHRIFWPGWVSWSGPTKNIWPWRAPLPAQLFHSLRTSGATLLVVYAQCQPTSMVVTFRTCSRFCIRLYCNHPGTSSLTSGSFLGGDPKHPDQRKQAYS